MSTSCVVVLDKNGILIGASRAACQMLGSDLAGLLGTKLSDRMRCVAGEEVDASLSRVAGAQVPQARPCHDVVARLHNVESGSDQWVTIDAEPIFDLATGALTSVAVTIADVSMRSKPTDAFQKERRMLGDVTSHANCALLLLDEQARVTYANQLAWDWFGGSGWIVDRPCHSVLGQESSGTERLVMQSFRTGKALRGDDFGKWVGGEEMLFQPVATPVTCDDGETCQVALVIFDVTERRRAGKWLRNAMIEVRRRNVEVSALLASARSVLKVRDYRQTAREIYDRCKHLIGAEAGCVLRCAEDSTVTESLLIDPGGLPCSASISLSKPLHGLAGEAYRTCKPVHHNGLACGSLDESLPTGQLPLRSVLYVPLSAEGRVFGLLGLANKPGGFDESDVRLAAAFAELMAVALHNSYTLSLLEKSEERLRRLAENAPDVILRYDLIPTRGFTYVSLVVSKMLGYSPEEFCAGPNMEKELTHPDDLPFFDGRLAATDSRPILCRWRHKDGRWVWTEQRTSPIYDDLGELIAIEGIVRDVTEQKCAEDALRESEERYRSVVAALEEGIILWNQEGCVAECNASAERILGLSRGGLLGRRDSSLGWEAYLEDGSLFAAAQHPATITLMTGRACSNVVMGISRPREGLVWISVNSRPLYREGETKPYGAVTSFSDITHRKRADEQMSLLARHVRLLLESTDVGIFGIDLRGRCTFLNSYGAVQLGYSPDEALGADIRKLIAMSPEDGSVGPQCACPVLSVLETGRGIRGSDQEFHRSDGSSFPVDYSSYPILDEGTITGAVVTFSDITQRMLAEGALRESQAQLAEAQRLAHLGSYRWDVRGASLSFSEETRNILEFKLSADSVSLKDWLNLIPPDDLPTVLDALNCCTREGKGYSFECRIALPDGRVKHVQVLGKPEIDSSGDVTRVTGTMMDITERKQLEERLLRAQRLETAGRISGQVAHDFNNLLAPLALYPDLLKMQLSDGHPALKYCDGMLEVVQQMADINADLLTLGRRGHFELQIVDINRVVRQAMEGLIGKPDTLGVILDLTADLSLVRGSSAQLVRVVTNLVLNAREAMHDVGTLHVKTENVYVDAPFAHYDQVTVGDYVRLTVRDSGHGVPPAIRDRIFDAFFTTKMADKKPGTGLGLSIVLAVVEDHHGYLDLESQVAEGSSFFVYLPVCRDKPERLARSSVRGGAESILVVDDDRALREAVAELLRQLGYRAEVMSGGDAAVDFIANHPVDLLILDMMMPSGIDGTETFRRVRALRPTQRAVIMSGFAEGERVNEALLLGAGAFLRKPVSMEKLARAVREELDRA
jgi:PAS domain S-box-containing protein